MTEDEMVGCITGSMDMSLRKLQDMVKDRDASCAAVHGLPRIGYSRETEEQQSQAIGRYENLYHIQGEQ